MDQYLLCLLNSPLSEKDYVIIAKCLDNLFASSSQYAYASEFVELIAFLLKPVTRYVAVINTSKQDKNISWKLLGENSHILDTIEDDVTKTEPALECNSQCATDCVSGTLHSLADQLPAVGTYKLDILLGSDVLRELSVCNEAKLASAFIRLTRWHSAQFTIFEQRELDTDRVNEWCEIMNAQILLQDSKLHLGPSLWRGSVDIQSSNSKNQMCKGFQLQLDLEDNDSTSTFAAKDDAEDTGENQNLENVVLSSKLQIIDEVSFASIPPYFITPLTFRLYLNTLNFVNKDSSNFIEYLLRNKKVAFIAKLGYAVLREKSKPERRYCSEKWEKIAFLNDIKDSECFVSSFEKSITFAITKSSKSNHIVVYPLQDPADLNAEFFFEIVQHRVFDSSSRNSLEKYHVEYPFPVITEHVCQMVIHNYYSQNKFSKNGFYNYKKNDDFSSLMKNIESSFTSSQLGEVCTSELYAEEVDLSDWPERIELLQKQIKNEEEKENLFTNARLAQNFKLPLLSFTLSSTRLLESFLPSGEHKNSKNLEEIFPINHSDHLVTCSLPNALCLKWPKIANCVYHDLYYNSGNQTEDKEYLGSQLINLYIPHETASTCNNQQLIQNFQIVVSEKTSSPSKAFRGPSSRVSSISNDETLITISPNPRSNSFRELITKSILSTSANIVSPDSTKKTSTEARKRHTANKSLPPVRCSPRKKNPVDYRYPVNRNIKNNRNIESNKISDLLRKKMRYAVAKALEDNGINSTDPMYQPCGAKLINICRTFLGDLKLKKGKTSEYLQKIADSHVKQVIEFYKDT